MSMQMRASKHMSMDVGMGLGLHEHGGWEYKHVGTCLSFFCNVWAHVYVCTNMCTCVYIFRLNLFPRQKGVGRLRI